MSDRRPWIYWHPRDDRYDGPHTIRKKLVSFFTEDTRQAWIKDGWQFEPLYTEQEMHKIPTAQELLIKQYDINKLAQDLILRASNGCRHLVVEGILDPKLKQYLVYNGYTITLEAGNNVINW